MATIGWIKVGITTDTSGLVKGANESITAIDGLGSKLAGLGPMIAGGLAAVGAYAFGTFVKGAMDAIDETRVFAERLGVSTEALSKLQYAGSIADVDIETLRGSLEKLNVRLAEVAQEGKGPAADALKRLGLSASDLAQQGPIEAFHQLAGVIENIKSPAERAAVAVDLFGKAGQGMLNLVAQGKGGIGALEKEASAFGVAISDIDAAKIDEANDSMTRIWSAVSGLGNAVAIELAPYITEIAQGMISFVKSTTGVAILKGIVQSIVTPIRLLVDGVHYLRIGFLNLGSAALGVWGTVLDGINALVKKFSFVADAVWGLKLGFTEFGSVAVGVWASVLDGVYQFTGKLGGVATHMHELSEKMAADADAIWTKGPASKQWADTGIESINRLALRMHSLSEGMAKDAEGLWMGGPLSKQIEKGAAERAKEAADLTAAFRAPGAMITADPSKTKDSHKGAPMYAGALALGSKEAYSAILNSRGLASNPAQQDSARSLRELVEIGKRNIVALDRLASNLGGRGNALVTNLHSI